MTSPIIPTAAISRNVHEDMLVLCVDDDAAILEITEAILRKRGLSVLTARNWRDALNAVQSAPLDLVLLDYEMPEMKGHEVALLIRNIKPALPLVLRSGAPYIPEHAMNVADAFIPKGTDWPVVVAAILDLVKRSKANRTPAIQIV